MLTRCQQKKKLHPMPGAMIKYTTYMLSCQSKSSKLRERSKVRLTAVIRAQPNCMPQAHQGTSEPVLDSGNGYFKRQWTPQNGCHGHIVRRCKIFTSPKASLEKASNSIVTLISKVTISAARYFGKISNKSAAAVPTCRRVVNIGEEEVSAGQRARELPKGVPVRSR